MKTQEKTTTAKKDTRIQAHYVHVTIHKLEDKPIGHWVKKGMSFRANTVACLVGLEENHEEEKGLHAHIVIQFSTRQKLTRKHLVDHFGSDSLHIAVKKDKQALMMALGYISKTGNVKQEGAFTYKNVPLSTDPEVYRFQYQVKSVDDGFIYFEKVIREHIGGADCIVPEMAKREDAIGRWLREKTSHAKTLEKYEHLWKLDYKNSKKKGFSFAEFVDEPSEFKEAYRTYLKEYPRIFKAHLADRSDLKLENDFDRHEEHDLAVLEDVMALLKNAQKYGYDRPLKSLNLYLWSTKPSFGKTRILNFLEGSMVAYRLPDDQYYVDYSSLRYEVLVSDEAEAFIASKTYAHLKLIFEGQRVEFNRKNKTKVVKEDNPLIVLAENVSFDSLMEDRFPKRYKKEVMDTRVLDLEIRSRATLHFFLDRCIAKPDDTEQMELTLE